MGIRTHNILGLQVAITTMVEAVRYIIQRASSSEGGYVCAANVHMCMESHDDPAFKDVVNRAALVVPDGKPLYWWMKSLGEVDAHQIRGPDLFLALCREAEIQGLPVSLYGGSEPALGKLRDFISRTFPGLDVPVAISPPYRALTEEEERKYSSDINNSGASILFVALGCPKQEKWMAAHASKINPVMIGVGAAFDFYAGTIPEAPEWMRNAGLEWLYRLGSEPGRLWKRYLFNNPRFIFYYIKALIAGGRNKPKSGIAP